MDEQKLNEMYELTKENHSMLRAMRRNALIGGILKFIFWLVIFVVIPYFTFLYFQPYIQGVMNAYQAINGKASTVQSSTGVSLAEIQKFFEQFGTTTKK